MATMAPERDGAEASPSQRFEHLVLDFLAHLEFERGLSRNTLAAYRTDLLQFGRFLAEHDVEVTSARPSTFGSVLPLRGGFTSAVGSTSISSARRR